MKAKPFGWEVDLLICDKMIREDWNSEKKTLHYRGCSETSARRRAMMNKHAFKIAAVRPVSEDEWIRAYGIGRL